MNEEFKLYFYGFGARIIQFVGVLVLIGGLFGIALGNGIPKTMIISTLFIIGGVGILLFGKAMRFKYKMHSGNIIHRGDW